MLFKQDLSVVAIIGIILLIGIVKKNGIMMVDFALELQREVHHHNAVLLDNADEQDDADDGDDAQVLLEKHQRQERAHSGGRQGGEDGDGMNEALIEHAEDNVD